MKITDVIVYEVKPRWIFVKVCTDEGIEGWGEMISGTKIFLQRWSNQWYDCIWI